MPIRKPEQTVHVNLTHNKRDNKTGVLKTVKSEMRTIQDVTPEEVWRVITDLEIAKMREIHSAD